MSSYSRYDDRRHSSSSRRDSSQSSSRRDRDSGRRSSPGPSRGRSPPPPSRPRDDNELPLEFGRPMEPTSKEDENTVIRRMKTAFTHSPLFVIYECIKDNLKIKIWTRNFKEVRGICTGYVIAFDKHWNLILCDVEEVYLKPRKAKTPYLLDAEDGEYLPELPPKVPRVKKTKTSEEAAQKKAEEEAAQNIAEEETAQNIAEEETGQNKAEEETGQNKAEEEAAQNIAEEEAAQNIAEEEAAQNIAEEETASEKPKKVKRKKGRKIHKRHLKQLFVRGDNIVMLSVVGGSDVVGSPEREY